MFREPFQMLGVPVSVPLDQFWSFLSNQTRIYIYNYNIYSLTCSFWNDWDMTCTSWDSIHTRKVCLSHLNPQHPVTSLTRRARFGSPFSEKLLSMGLIETLPIYGYYNLSQSQWSSMIYSQDLFESGFDLWWKEKHTLTLVLYIIISYVWIWLITDNVWSGDRILPPNNVQQMQTSNLKSNPTLKWSWIVWKHYFH